jgi:hypothetical protein
MSPLQKLGLLLALTLVVPASVPSSSLAGPPDHARACHRVALKGTIMSKFNYTLVTWQGRALISLDGGPAREATVVTISGDLQFKEDGAPYGTELNQIIFDDGSGSFEISARWESSWTGTPGLLDFYSVGKLQNGTGDYAGIAGPLITIGPFLSPFPQFNNVDTLFIGEMYGSVRGLAQ